eukprot:408255_1
MVFKPIAEYLTTIIYETLKIYQEIRLANGNRMTNGKLMNLDDIHDVAYGIDNASQLFCAYPLSLLNNKALLEDIIRCRQREDELAKKLQADEYGLRVIMQAELDLIPKRMVFYCVINGTLRFEIF